MFPNSKLKAIRQTKSTNNIQLKLKQQQLTNATKSLLSTLLFIFLSSIQLNTCHAGPTRDLLLQQQQQQPDFEEPIGNQSVAVGKEARLRCKTTNLGPYRTAWLRVEDKGILTIHNNVITRNYRISLDNEIKNEFVLIIKDVKPTDKGGYMCQINSVPMRFVIGYLDVLTPPIFVDNNNNNNVSESADSQHATAAAAGATVTLSATDDAAIAAQHQSDAPSQISAGPASESKVTVAEGSNATLSCRAIGHPQPVISWRREDGQPINLLASNDDSSATTVNNDNENNGQLQQHNGKLLEGNSLAIPIVNRLHSGAYLCIANNGVQPAASRRQVLDVQFSPIIRLPQIDYSASQQQAEVQLECFVELNPNGAFYWAKLAPSHTTDKQPVSVAANQQEADDLWLIEHDALMSSDKFEIVIKQVAADKVQMILIVRRVEKQDFGWYKCIARNTMGIQSSAVKLSESDKPTPEVLNNRNKHLSQLTNTDTDHQQQQHQLNSRQKNPHTRASWSQRSTSSGGRTQQVGSTAAAAASSAYKLHPCILATHMVYITVNIVVAITVSFIVTKPTLSPLTSLLAH